MHIAFSLLSITGSSHSKVWCV